MGNAVHLKALKDGESDRDLGYMHSLSHSTFFWWIWMSVKPILPVWKWEFTLNMMNRSGV